MRRLVVIANGISPPGTMGGNSKIILEMLRHRPEDLECLVVTPKSETFSENRLNSGGTLKIASIPEYGKSERTHYFGTCRHLYHNVKRVFEENRVGPGDVVYCVSDFGADVVPACRLCRELGFTWIPSFFLFVPFIFENLKNHYGFPPLKYLVYYLYQKHILRMMEKRAHGVVITNEVDKKRFSPRLQEHALAIYGGVNVEQIPSVRGAIRYDAVFCSRLHPQKGISGLLNIWARVVAEHPPALLAIIGNGEPQYESHLREKARLLGIDGNVKWLGYVNNEAKYEIYGKSRFLVHSTVYDNNGMVAAEALCTGLPVVMYDLPALREVYKEGCVKVPCFDQAVYAETVLRLLGDEEELARVRPSESEVARLRGHWNWKARSDLFYEFMRSASSRRT